MKVSVIIPVYNVEQYIKRCILSVMHQTYTGDMECILVDDCGTDNSIALAEQVIANYKGTIDFSVLHHKHNRGLSAARNTGTDAATGDYIFYLDSDDELPNESIEILTQQLYKYPDAQYIQGCTVSIPEREYYDTRCFMNNSYVTNNVWIRNGYYSIVKTIPVNAWNKLLKVDFLRQNKLYFKEGIIHEDEHWMFYLVKHCTSMAFVFAPTYLHYYTSNSIMSSLTNERSARSWEQILNDWILCVDDISFKEQLIKMLSIYRWKEIHKYANENYSNFWRNVGKVLLKYKQYKAFFWLTLWKMSRPYREIGRFYRYMLESLY